MTDAAPGLTCPNCQTPLNTSDQFCTGCGFSLDTITFLMANANAAPDESFAETPLTTFPRLGEFLIQRGLLTEAQLEAALTRQRELAAGGEHKMLGELVVELGFVTSGELQRAIADQVTGMQGALAENNRLLKQRVAERTAQLEQAIRHVNEVNQLKTNFIANISHELRTPLTQMQGFLSLMHDGALGYMNPELARHVDKTYAEVLKLGRLIENLIRFVAVSRGEMYLEKGRVRLDEAARKALNQARPKADQRGVTLKDDLPAQPVWVETEAEKLGWVLLQLLDNGIKFTPEGGAAGLRLGAGGQPGSVRVTVWDTGVGIPAEKMPELFQPLRRVGESTPRQYTGTGLGLVLAGRIVNAHESEIHVESTVGQGTTVWFDLPRADE